METPAMATKIGTVGGGFVGSTTAYAMVMRGVGSDIVILDLNRGMAEAWDSDIVHAVAFAHSHAVRGDHVPQSTPRAAISCSMPKALHSTPMTATPWVR